MNWFQFCFNFAFNFNLRRYTVAVDGDANGQITVVEAGRCRLTLSNPR